MEVSKISRKACDFCYVRKIKCDGQKPRCSQCVTYLSECTYEAPSRKARPRKRKESARTEDSTDNIHIRVQHLEALLEKFTKGSAGAGVGAGKQNGLSVRLQEPGPISSFTLPITAPDQVGSTDHKDSPHTSMELPPLRQVLSLVNTFLQKFNTVLPLFHPETLLRLVHDTCKLTPQQRSPVAWAAINVVLGLTYRHGLVGSPLSRYSIEYLNRAQSVLSEVILRDVRLLNVQVLVGMVILFQGSQDLQPALILIATTMRLVHRLGMNGRAASAHLSPALASQHANVFWMAYILDKDLSFRCKQPSIQLDDDIDLALPYTQAEEDRIDGIPDTDADSIGSGIVATADGTVKMNYFVTRIQLAALEGGVYDYLHSVRSQKRSPEDRLNALESLSRALEQWKASIPPEFTGVECPRRVASDKLWYIYILDATSLLCKTAILQVHAWHAPWVTSLRRYGREGDILELPPHWATLVDEARDLLVLFGHLGSIDRWNFW
ncbi:hypothetical protein LTR84_002164 [Exophiala bonariae]|uniref:Zn(2)-C6 fungal-type domain-containing protein n=1 Tax=Exophiala bonariae TaxID=1690606 RepID=A0AAV9NAS9_9EURO|nr:hypothetical protein LTR84_002164 [Exophiala bonariae]